jgi:hypothetical protein
MQAVISPAIQCLQTALEFSVHVHLGFKLTKSNGKHEGSVFVLKSRHLLHLLKGKLPLPLKLGSPLIPQSNVIPLPVHLYQVSQNHMITLYYSKMEGCVALDQSLLIQRVHTVPHKFNPRYLLQEVINTLNTPFLRTFSRLLLVKCLINLIIHHH